MNRVIPMLACALGLTAFACGGPAPKDDLKANATFNLAQDAPAVDYPSVEAYGFHVDYHAGDQPGDGWCWVTDGTVDVTLDGEPHPTVPGVYRLPAGGRLDGEATAHSCLATFTAKIACVVPLEGYADADPKTLGADQLSASGEVTATWTNLDYPCSPEEPPPADEVAVHTTELTEGTHGYDATPVEGDVFGASLSAWIFATDGSSDFGLCDAESGALLSHPAWAGTGGARTPALIDGTNGDVLVVGAVNLNYSAVWTDATGFLLAPLSLTGAVDVQSVEGGAAVRVVTNLGVGELRFDETDKVTDSVTLFDRTSAINLGPLHGAGQTSDPLVWLVLTIVSGPSAVVGAYDTTDSVAYVKLSDVSEDSSGLPARFGVAGDFACCTFPDGNAFVMWDFSDPNAPKEAARVAIPGNPTDWSAVETAPGVFDIYVATTAGPYWLRFDASTGEVPGQGLLQVPAGWDCDYVCAHIFAGGRIGLFCDDLDEPVVHSLLAPDLALTAETTIP